MDTAQSNFWARLWEVNDYLKKIVEEFERTYEEEKLTKELPLVQVVYMHEIIINLWMILGNGSNDEYKLSNLKEHFKSTALRNQVKTLLTTHFELIERIGKNRNRISVHLDPRLVDLKFSEEYVDAHEKRFKTKAPELRAKSRKEERITPRDLKNDLPEIKKILKEVDNIWESIISATRLENQSDFLNSNPM